VRGISEIERKFSVPGETWSCGANPLSKNASTMVPAAHVPKVQARKDAREVPLPRGVHKLAPQQLDLPIHPRYARSIVANGANDSGAVGAMAVIIHRV